MGVDLEIEWRVTSQGNCFIEVYNDTWNIVNQTCPGTSDEFIRINISNIAHNETLAENLRVRINYTRETTGTLYVDLITINITYLPPHPFLSWNLINSTRDDVGDGKNFTRTDFLNASAQWSNTISSAVLEHNGTGVFVNYSVPGPFADNWTNYTINFSNYTQFPLSGNVTVNGIYATDEYGQENVTSPPRFFFLWGHAGVEGLSLSSSSALNGSSVTLYCNVTDSNSSAVVPGYNVSFWKNSTFLGSNITNSSGLASWLHQDDTQAAGISRNFTMECNLTDQPSLYYSASESSSGSSLLTVADILEINLTLNATLYNRGENLTLKLLDTSNRSVANVSWNITLEKFNQSLSVLFAGYADNYTFSINASDPVGNWTLTANATKEGREIVQKFSFNVSSNLTPDFTQPPSGSSFAADSAISPRPQVRVKNARGEVLNYTRTGSDVYVNLSCPNGLFPLGLSGGIYQNTNNDCLASSSAGTTFSLLSVANDSFNNSGSGTLSLRTNAPPSGGGTGGGGGGGGGLPPQQNCTCGDWITFSCGAGGCLPEEVYQTRICAPAGCAAEERCVYNPICSGEMDFNFTISSDYVEVVQGEERTIRGTVSNTGDLLLSAGFLVEAGCCEIPEPAGLEIPVLESRGFTLSVHASLTEEPGEYQNILNITANNSANSITKTAPFTVRVLENPLKDEMQELQDQLKELESSISEYKETGVDTTALEVQQDSIRSLIDGAFSGIHSNSLQELENNLNQARAELESAFQAVSDLGLVKVLMENRWWILTGIILAIVAAYLITEVLVPFYVLGRDIMALTKEEKSLIKTRKETEIQYFNRIIDEDTFKKLLVEGQGKILRTRGALNTKKESRSTLIRDRLSPTSLGKWLVGWVRKENLGRMREKLVKRGESRHESYAKAHIRNILHGFGLRERSHPKIRLSSRKHGRFWERKSRKRGK